MKNNYTVYMHIFPNNKVYIGITKMNIKKRWLNGKGYKTSKKLNYAIQKYGWENVNHKILYEDLTKEEAEQKEIELIAQYHSTNDKYGYNIEKGGNHQGKMSNETKEKLSIIMKGKNVGSKNGMYGKHHTLEAKEKIGEAHLGKPTWNKGLKNCFSNETKEKMKEHFKNKEKEKIRISKMLETKIKRHQMYLTDEERHQARLSSFKKYKEKHKEEIKNYNKEYRLKHKKQL